MSIQVTVVRYANAVLLLNCEQELQCFGRLKIQNNISKYRNDPHVVHTSLKNAVMLILYLIYMALHCLHQPA